VWLERQHAASYKQQLTQLLQFAGAYYNLYAALETRPLASRREHGIIKLRLQWQQTIVVM